MTPFQEYMTNVTRSLWPLTEEDLYLEDLKKQEKKLQKAKKNDPYLEEED